jgi:hypothetical protein
MSAEGCGHRVGSGCHEGARREQSLPKCMASLNLFSWHHWGDVPHLERFRCLHAPGLSYCLHVTCCLQQAAAVKHAASRMAAHTCWSTSR